MKIEIKARSVEGRVRNGMPGPDDDITEVITITPEFLERIVFIDIYLRPIEVCPFARGNWIVDIELKGDFLFCLKLPKEMTEEHVLKYCKPLTDKIKEQPK